LSPAAIGYDTRVIKARLLQTQMRSIRKLKAPIDKVSRLELYQWGE